MAFVTLPSALPLRHARRSLSARTRPQSHSHQLTRRAVPCAQLIGMPDGFNQSGKNMEASAEEVLLAELMFTEPDNLPAIIQSNIPLLDEKFYNFLDDKINTTIDIPERETLRTLKDAITDIMRIILEETTAENPDAKKAIDARPADVAEATYDELIDKMAAGKKDGVDGLKMAVDASYERIDMRFLERLGERIKAMDEDVETLAELRDTISVAMNERVVAATNSLKVVLSAGDPKLMRGEIDKLARMGKIDDAFILLLQGNIEQAKQAGATQAMEIMSMLLDHTSSISELMLEPEVKLIRSLLRTDDSEARIEKLMDALAPKGSVTLIDGSASSGVRVNGKKFVDALRKLIEDFGNVDEKFVLKLSTIGEESETVARKIYDMEGKDVKDLQDEAFHKRSVSIWDLEKYEIEEQIQGREASWEGRLGAIPEGFGEDGKLQL